METAGFDAPTRSAMSPSERLELVDEQREGARLLDRRQLLARDVLDEPEQQRVAIGCIPNERRQRLKVRLARRPPAPLARDSS